MGYEVFARKWRPQQFEDVVGQDHVARTLQNAIKSKRIAHAYLFVGPRGIGKTSIARIFAKCLNCNEGVSTQPCDECDSCREITAGNSLDVLEIDGASNNGVEQVRDLRDTVKFMPGRGAYKVYIIDEVHMLSTAAFNALLKTLEEPPEHVIFLFATTEPDRIPATILSRCQRFDLRRISAPLITERLKLIADKEKIKVDEAALAAIARGAEGGLRDAESSLDQIVSFKGTEIAEEDVLSIFGLVSGEVLENLSSAVLKCDVKEIIGTIAGLDEKGKDLHKLAIELISHFRNLLVWLYTGPEGAGPELLESEAEALREQAGITDVERVLRIVQVLTETEQRMRHALSRRILLETALIRCARAAKVVSIEQIVSRLNEITKTGGSAGPPPEVRTEKTTDDRTRKPVKKEKRDPGGDRKKDTAALNSRWGEIIKRIGKVDPLVRGFILDALPVSADGGEVIVGFEKEFAGEADRVKTGEGHKTVEHVIGSVLGKKTSVQFREIESLEADKIREGLKSGEKDAEGKNWVEDPAVKKTLEMFDGKITDVRE
ncbi:MAG: DNA polymerase III subunit gamma/tau [Kiritimatiellia bacterium]